ncbi:MAG: Unknown protein [uncultured Sulfurovum sp.]|uniref:Uncharacterized protein n=1 Tax=uncultured Sulfurovum sp. TaxID=269237 RepID=A0A6S6TEU4_9BACT|nr:MAG: Unknown protein [uncultured Sulfurovum sp.]
MNLKIIEKSLLPLFLATIFIVAFNWQFTYIYTYLIEHFKDEKLSTLYAHLFIYSFLVFSIFLFFMNLLNQLLKSKVFIIVISIMLFSFYGLSYKVIYNNVNYFIQYPLTDQQLTLMVLFIVSTFIYGLYSLSISLFNKFVPMLHSFVFLLITLSYSVWFINLYCYPIRTILSQFGH